MTIRRVHVVYPHGPSVATPDAIGRELGRHLRQRYEVTFHDWAGFERIPASPDAAIVGHAHPVPGTTFRRSVRQPGWGRRVLLQPFVTELDQIGYIGGVVPNVDHFVAICGRHWERLLPTSFLRSIEPTFTQVDLAVDPEAFPLLVDEGRPPGDRSLVYVGRDVPMKNLGFLERIAECRPSWRVARVGPPGKARPSIEYLGPLDFGSSAGRELISSFDIMITVGRADANPTTVLEAMAWGLVPVCTAESGYEGYDGIANVPLGDVDRAVAVLDRLQEAPAAEITALRRANRARVEVQYSWDRFSAAVEEAIVDRGMGPASVSTVVQAAATARWWATALRASNRSGLRDSLVRLTRLATRA
jgi:hypothetical protein